MEKAKSGPEGKGTSTHATKFLMAVFTVFLNNCFYTTFNAHIKVHDDMKIMLHNRIVPI